MKNIDFNILIQHLVNKKFNSSFDETDIVCISYKECNKNACYAFETIEDFLTFLREKLEGQILSKEDMIAIYKNGDLEQGILHTGYDTFYFPKVYVSDIKQLMQEMLSDQDLL